MIKFYCDICNKDITDDTRINLEMKKVISTLPN